MTLFKEGDFVSIAHYVKLKFGEIKWLYSRVGLITEVQTGNVQLVINTPGEIDPYLTMLNRIDATDDFFDEITGIYNRLEIIK